MSNDVVAQMAGLKERFGKLSDPRSSINQRHSLVDVKDAIVSIDAMGTQTAITGKIIDKGGD